jgi:chromosome partitioning protein
MFVVAVVATKGGAGKSTLAVHLAIAAANRRRRPLILDFDKKQLSLLIWSKGLRKSQSRPGFAKGCLETLRTDLETASSRHDLVVIDVAAGGGDEVRDIAALANHVIVPVRASAFDMAATRNTIELLRNTADNTEPEELACRNALGKASIVLNCVPKRPSARWRREVDEALEASGAGNVPIIGMLADREAFRTAIEHGRGVTEEGDDEAAMTEILAVYDGLAAIEAERNRRLEAMRRNR